MYNLVNYYFFNVFMISVCYRLDCNILYKNIDEVKINKEIKKNIKMTFFHFVSLM